MSFLRFLLAVALVYYLLKIIGGWFRGGDRKKSGTVKGGRNGSDLDLKNLTDQTIDDADFDEL